MESSDITRPAPETAAVTAPTLEEAYRMVRAGFGADAFILGTRRVTRPRRDGLGLQRLVEVTVACGPSASQAPWPAGADRLVARLEDEVRRLEARIATLLAAGPTGPGERAEPLVAALVRTGASPATALDLATRFRAEATGQEDDFLPWLTGHVRTAGGTWDDVAGLHAVVGCAGSGRTRLVLAAARETATRGRRVLALSMAPRHPGEIRRLQAAAGAGNFDAAVVHRPDAIVDLSARLGEYHAVFVDLPALEDPALAADGELHAWLAGHHGIHRHLLVPLDLDPADLDHLPAAARALNCDWLAVGRLDRTRRPGKLLDLVDGIPLPLSLLTGTEEATLAGPEALARILALDAVAREDRPAGEDTA